MLKLWLIRHGMTEGNRYQRYIGVTDEPLAAEGRAALHLLTDAAPEAVFVSPLTRCRETAEILFPGMPLRIIDQLAECDFGEFENKNYKELDGNVRYQAWVDSGGTLPFPGGESREGFRKRTLEGFSRAVTACIREELTEAALVVHGGSIMTIMEAYARPERSFYDWHVGNGGGYLVELDPFQWKNNKFILKCVKSCSAGK